MKLRVVVLLCLLAFLVVPSAAPASTAMCNVPIKTGDGVVLRANVWLPSPATGQGPDRPHRHRLQQGRDEPDRARGARAQGGIANADTSLADKGYAVMLVDDRGTGASQGKWDSWGERTQLDYQDVLDWIQAQPWSNGSVATTGGSYMGITSLLVAEADAARVRAGKPRAVKAVWADVPMSDAYRDVTFHGGATDAGFMPLWLGLTSSALRLPPSTTTRTRRARRRRGRTTCATPGGSPGQKLVEHDARRGRRLRRPVLPAALARRPRRPDQGARRHHRRLVGHLPARRAAPLRAADERAGQEALHVAALPHAGGPAMEDPGSSASGSTAG